MIVRISQNYKSMNAILLQYYFCISTRRIIEINWIIANIGIEVNLVLISNRISLEEPGTCRRRCCQKDQASEKSS